MTLHWASENLAVRKILKYPTITNLSTICSKANSEFRISTESKYWAVYLFL